jgi:hypothetical protein
LIGEALARFNPSELASIAGGGKPISLDQTKHVRHGRKMKITGSRRTENLADEKSDTNARALDHDHGSDDDDEPKRALTFSLPGNRKIEVPWEVAREWDVSQSRPHASLQQRVLKRNAET